MKLQQFVLTLAGVLATLPSLSVATAVPNAPGTPGAIEEPAQVSVSVDELDIPEAFRLSAGAPPGGACKVYTDCARCKPGYWRCCLAGCHGMLVPGSHTCGCIQDGHDVGPTCGCN